MNIREGLSLQLSKKQKKNSSIVDKTLSVLYQNNVKCWLLIFLKIVITRGNTHYFTIVDILTHGKTDQNKAHFSHINTLHNHLRRLSRS